MADLAVVADNVRVGSAATVVVGTAGETISRGDSIYIRAFNTRVYKTDTNEEEASQFDGFAISDAIEGEPIMYQTPAGKIYLGVDTDPGVIYVLSGTAGKIMPSSDGGSGDYTTIVGVGDNDGNLDMTVQGDTGYQLL